MLERLVLRFGQNKVIQFQFVLNVTVIYQHIFRQKEREERDSAGERAYRMQGVRESEREVRERVRERERRE